MSNIAFGPFVLSPEARILTKDGKRVPLTAKVLDTLIILVRNRGRVITKDELLASVWPDTTVEEGNLTQNISMLRKVLADNPKDPHYIATVAGRGYSFVAPISETGLAESRQSRVRLWVALTTLAATAVAGTAGFFLFKKMTEYSPPSEQRIVPFTADPGVETMPAFSPDGKQIVFVRTERDPQPWRGFWKEYVGPATLCLKTVDAGTELHLTSGSSSDALPAWSPDGQQIAFFRRTATGDLGYYVVSSVGGPERRIGNASNSCGGLAWFPDGKRLVVSEVSDTAAASPLIVIATDTGERRTMTSPSRGIDVFPAFSPDGETLAFVRGVDYGDADVFIMQAEGGPVRRLTSDGNWKSGVSWTPDRQEIIICSQRGASDSGMWRIPLSGGAPRQIAIGDQYVTKVAIAPRGNRFAYVAVGAAQHLRQIEIPTNPRMPVNPIEVASSTRDQNEGQYSPDGTRVAFQSGRSGTYEIWAADVPGGQNARRLTDLNGAGSPAWSPDGKEIAFDGKIHGNRDIWTVHADGGPARHITNSPYEDAVPSWSHDGKWIYFASNRTGRFQIWKVPASGESPGTPAVQVTTGGGFHGVETADGLYLYFSKDRANAAIWRRPLADGIGREQPLIPSMNAWGWWTLSSNGIMYLERSGQAIRLMTADLNGRFVRSLAEIPGRIDGFVQAIGASPDGRHVILTQTDPGSADIMLIEGFR
jgi:Tol biopolymer transport system component/DNA-binding winged helix-turn-helix (wHTH) protein